MVPKTIHFFWFGKNKKPRLINRCIISWIKYCYEYEIIEWNEDNFDVNACLYSKQAYEAGKWAFVSDYARLVVLYNQGGVYLDTDMELFKPLDPYIENGGALGFEAKDYVAAGVMAFEKHSPLIKEMLDEYENISFIKPDGSYDCTTNVQRMRGYLLKKGLVLNGKRQTVDGITIYEQNIFYPNTFGMLLDELPKKTVALHHAAATWNDNQRKEGYKKSLRSYLVNKARNIIGTDNLVKLKACFSVRKKAVK